MVTRAIEPEVKQALHCIEREENFILTGGAGSGKTHSLISLIEEIGKKYPLSSIICITYTNNAVAEIRNRITNDKLQVSTIHEFIWSIISKFQCEIKETLVELINKEDQKNFELPEGFNGDQKIKVDYFNNSKIGYDEFYSLKSDMESKISHDHILILAERMFGKYPKLCDILRDVANFIFVDEYQDTSPLVTKILLDHMKQSSKKSIVGFFGDSMQAIYDNGVGEISDDHLISIIKNQNRRNPRVIIDLTNKLREDGIKQIPSTDLNAPNMKNGEILHGSIKFIYADSIDELDSLRKSDYFEDWTLESKKTKELWLVQKANAKMAGFTKLFELYNSDPIIELINKMRKKIENQEIDTNYWDFESLAEKANIYVRGRGNLLKNIKEDPNYQSILEWIKGKCWEEVCSYRINKDSLLSYKFNGLTGKYEAKTQRDKILRHLDSIYELIELYKDKRYNEFLRKIKWKISCLEDKKRLIEGLNKLSSENLTIGRFIRKAEEILDIQDDSFENYIKGQGIYLWRRIKEFPINEYINSIEYQKEHLPFATQHSIKGSEFDNVLVVLDNGNWRNYNFDSLFKNTSKESIAKRTKKLFYVCCSRAKKNLCVFMPTSDPIIIEKAKELFGEDNVVHHY